jgi:hypothetical protein
MKFKLPVQVTIQHKPARAGAEAEIDFGFMLSKNSTVNAVLLAWVEAIGWKLGNRTKARFVGLLERGATNWTMEEILWVKTLLPLAHKMFDAIVQPGPAGPLFAEVMGSEWELKDYN